METALIWVGASVLAVATLLVIASVYIWWLRRRYSRERFAFRSFTALIALATAYTTAMMTGTYLWDMPMQALYAVLDKPYVPAQPSRNDLIVMLIPFALLVWLASYIFKHWRAVDGFVPRDQLAAGSDYTHASLLTGALQELQRMRRRDIPKSPPEGADSSLPIVSIVEEPPAFSWRHRALQLAILSDSSLRFGAREDETWDNRYKVWRGAIANTSREVLIVPTKSIPTSEEVLALCEQLAPASKNTKPEILVVAREGPANNPPLPDGPPHVRVVTQSHLLDGLVDIADYVDRIRERVEQTTLSGSNLTLAQVYVDPAIAEDAEVKPSLAQVVSDWIIDDTRDHLAVLGSYGQGKSSAALLTTYTGLMDPATLGGRTPILIELRGSSPRDLTPLQLLGAWAADYAIKPRALWELHLAGRLVIFFDGFDEMTLIGDRRLRLEHFRSLWEFATPHSKLIFTGRPNFFFDEDELAIALNLEPSSGQIPRCRNIRLELFTPDRAAAALTKYSSPPGEQRTAATVLPALMRVSTDMADLLSRPSMLHLAGLLWGRGELDADEDKLTSYELTGRFVRSHCARQSAKGLETAPALTPGGGAFMVLNSAEREHFMEGIALHMVRYRLPNQIRGEELDSLVRRLYENVPESVSREGSIAAREPLDPLRERLSEDETLLDSVGTDVRATGLLTDDTAVTGRFRFGHKSYMEYEAAHAIARALIDFHQGGRSLLNTYGISRVLTPATPHEVMDYLTDAIGSHQAGSVAALRLMLGEYRKLVGPFRGWTTTMAVSLRFRPYSRARRVIRRLGFPSARLRLSAPRVMSIFSIGLFATVALLVFSLSAQGVDRPPVALSVTLILIGILFPYLWIARRGMPDWRGSTTRFFVLLISRCRLEDMQGITLFPWLAVFGRQRVAKCWAARSASIVVDAGGLE